MYLEAQGVAPGGNGVRLAQCGLRAQLRVAISGVLVSCVRVGPEGTPYDFISSIGFSSYDVVMARETGREQGGAINCSSI